MTGVVVRARYVDGVFNAFRINHWSPLTGIRDMWRFRPDKGLLYHTRGVPHARG